MVNPHLNSKSRGKVSLKATSEIQDVVKGHKLEVHNSIHEQEDFKLTGEAVAKKDGKLAGEKARDEVFTLIKGIVRKHRNRQRVVG